MAANGELTFSVRRSDADDVDTVSAMIERTFADELSLDSFGLFHGLEGGAMKVANKRQKFILSLIETCFVSVTVEDEETNIVGFAALDDAPLQMLNAEGAGTDWESWFEETYDAPDLNSTNTLWFSCCLCETDPGIMAEILRNIFASMPELQYLLVFCPSEAEEDATASSIAQPFDENLFERLEVIAEIPLSGHWASDGQHGIPRAVYCCSRSTVITPLTIRMAKVEDHDNLAAVFDAQSEVVTEIYGEFFIAELIEAQNEENRALVAEVDGRAVGLMCLTSDVDINVLAQCFQLDAYDNLLKPKYMRRVREHARSALEGQMSSLCTQGDYLQVALRNIDIEALLESIPTQEDGRLSAVSLHQALQMQEFSDEVGDALQDFEKSMMVLLWQSNFLEPMLEGGSFIEKSKVVECVQIFLDLDLGARREIAAAVLEQWPKVEESFRLARDAPAPEAAPEDEEKKGEDDRQEASDNVDALVFLKALTVEDEGPFTQDFLVRLAMVLHWWTEEDLGSPLALVPDDAFKGAIEQVLNSEEGLFVGHPSSPGWLANMPRHAKDTFCVNIFCLDQAFQTQALDFMMPAFSLYPDKDYCIVTQPHTAPTTPLLSAFTIVPPQPQNTFGHVLYIIHRAALLGPPKVLSLSLRPEYMEQVAPLIEAFEDSIQEEILQCCELAMEQDEEPSRRAFVAEFDEQVVGLILFELPQPDVVDTLRCCYHLDDYLLIEHHAGQGKGHARLLHWVINPLFLKYTRRLLQGAMQICGCTVLFSEMELQSTVSPIFREMLQVAPRRPPQLKKARRKPPKVASFVNVEKPRPTEQDLRENERQASLRDTAPAQPKALSIVTKKLLSETKIPVNARIVVVGASDCGLSFLETLLSMPHLLFNSLTLLAPGGLDYHHSHHLPLVAGTAAYSHQELRRIMLELRVRILDSRLVQIDRQQRCCVLHDGSLLPYDYLVVAAGLQDDALHSLRLRSWGVEHVTDGYRKVNGAVSAADPTIRDLLTEKGILVKSLIWNPLSYVVVYGRSLHAYCLLQGLLLRKVPPTKIILVLPPRISAASGTAQPLSVDAFDDGDEVESKIHGILQAMNLKVFEGYRLLEIQQDNRERLKALVLEDWNSRGSQGDDQTPRPVVTQQTEKKDEKVEPRTPRIENDKAHTHCGILEDFGTSPSGLPQKILMCRLVITADAVNVDPDIFNSVHGNGLVYDGRLIVDHNFKTTDPAIFGAGSLCEFSRRFQRKNASRYLRHDGFNGREVGSKLAHALLRVLDPVNVDVQAAGGSVKAATRASMQDSGTAVFQGPSTMCDSVTNMVSEENEISSPDLLPEFYMPIAKAGLLPGALHYYRIRSCKRNDQAGSVEVKEDQIIVTDTLDPSNGKGHYCRLTMDSFGKVDSITYLGGEELQVESLWSLVGLSETFLNHLYVRQRAGDIPDIVEFLTDEWATALFHDRFTDFCHEIKPDFKEKVKTIIDDALDTINHQDGLSRKLLGQILQKLKDENKDVVKEMQDHLLDYLRENTNHLKTYFLPEHWEASK